MSIRVYDMRLIPGLLQTEAYIRAVNQTPGRNLPPGEVDRLVQMRMRRQEILDRDQPPVLHTIIDEAVLSRRIGDARVMRDQLTTLTTHQTALIQVLPLIVGRDDPGIRGGDMTTMPEWQKSTRSAQGESECVEVAVWSGELLTDSAVDSFA